MSSVYKADAHHCILSLVLQPQTHFDMFTKILLATVVATVAARPQGYGPPPGSAPGGISSAIPPRRPPTGPRPGFGRPSPGPSYSPSGPSGPVIPILVDERDGPHADGSYSFNFETGNGIHRQETGRPTGPAGAVVQQGGWSFTFPDGTPAVFNFVADENGYRVESDLIPTPPPLPPHAIAQIEKARQEDRAAAASGNRGSYSAPPQAGGSGAYGKRR